MNRRWKIALFCLFLAISASMLPNLAVIAFTVRTWASNETYTHGFLIFPIAAWLIWRKREILSAMSPEPAWPGLFPFLLLAVIWQLGHQADVMAVQQYGLIGMIVASSWIILGKKIFYQISFPLFFLFLSVPIGDALIPALMNFTADFTVDALQLTGIPVYREGTFFSLPDGNWSVVEACSGLRYLISSLTLGILYAYLTYHSLFRKLVFILFSALVPILANGVRAYMIVMIGHLAGMRYATGIDHLIYGWIFFGLVMLLLFWIGSFFKEKEDLQETGERQEALTVQESSSPFFAATTIILAIVLSNWAYASHLDRKLQRFSQVELNMPEIAGWQEDGISFWRPHYLGSRASINKSYRTEGKEVFLFVAYYRNQSLGKELVTSGNQLVTTTDPVWGKVGEAAIEAGSGKEKFLIHQAKLKSANGRLLAWEWYWVNGEWTSNPYRAKFLEAESRMAHGSDDAAEIVISTPYSTDPDQASAILGDFLKQSLPDIKTMLDHAARQMK